MSSSSGIVIPPNRKVKGQFVSPPKGGNQEIGFRQFVLVTPPRPIKNVGEYTMDDFTYFEKKWIREIVDRYPDEFSNEKICYLFGIFYEDKRLKTEEYLDEIVIDCYITNILRYIDTFENPNFSKTKEGRNIFSDHIDLEGVRELLKKLVENRFSS
jgi:hypothetical protein